VGEFGKMRRAGLLGIDANFGFVIARPRVAAIGRIAVAHRDPQVQRAGRLGNKLCFGTHFDTFAVIGTDSRDQCS